MDWFRRTTSIGQGHVDLQLMESALPLGGTLRGRVRLELVEPTDGKELVIQIKATQCVWRTNSSRWCVDSGLSCLWSWKMLLFLLACGPMTELLFIPIEACFDSVDNDGDDRVDFDDVGCFMARLPDTEGDCQDGLDADRLGRRSGWPDRLR
ncbi:MAG: hypothetical protein ACI9VR_003845 [Cognaticolwellia sp.]|jgi:hypothetical protein